jgi:hypothetical protein
MRSHRRIAHVAVTATLLLAFAASVSAAESFDVISNRISARWSSVTLEAAGLRVVCPLTLDGSFSGASFAATARTRVASITRATTGTCSEGRAVVLSETLPWSLQYSSFGGTLPNITSLTFRLLGASLRGTAGGLECLVRSSEERPINVVATRENSSTSETRGEITGLRLDERAGIPLRGGFACELAGESHLSGSGILHSEANEEGEGEHAFVALAGVPGMWLVNGASPPIEYALRGVTLAAGGEFTLVMVNMNPDFRIQLVSAGVVNPERYEWLNPPSERCMADGTLIRGRNNLCQMRIRRKAGTMATQNSSVRITYVLPFEEQGGAVVFEQEFSLIAS